MAVPISITALPTRYEPLTKAFGDKAKTTFVSNNADLEVVKRFVSAAESAHQGKMLFLCAESGTGKSTFVQSLEIFLSDKVGSVIRLPLPHELDVSEIPRHLAGLPSSGKFTIVNFDGREAPYFNEPEYQTFLGALNSVLRHRPDLLFIWPVTDENFAQKLIALLKRVGGVSAFGISALHQLHGLPKDQFTIVLEKILKIANWRLDDAAISTTEIDDLIEGNNRVGVFLDSLQQLIAKRFDIGNLGVIFPTLTIVVSSGAPKFRETCRSLRRADSYYIEASRLLMYTTQSKVANWWNNRATSLKSALPHVIALFNAQIVSISASSVVHSALQSGDEELKKLVDGVRADRGNAKKVISSSELYKFVKGEAVDNREYGSSVGKETYESFARLQAVSETKHRAMNEAIVKLVQQAGGNFPDVAYERSLVSGLRTDATYRSPLGTVALEFHHKAAAESTHAKIAVYILEKLKEYAINYGLAER